MTVSNFDKRIVIEQIRYMETQQALVCDAEQSFQDVAVQADFENRLWQRAQCLMAQHDLSRALGRAARLARYTKTATMVLAALLGASGVIYAVTDSQTLNIYWLLLVLLGFNLISMLLWLAGISLNMQALTAGMLARLTSWLPGHLEDKNTVTNKYSTQADRAWLACHFSGATGKWQLSKITHQLWLVYLCAGLVFLLLLLMVRQYDFVWGTTLLSDAAFVKLTELLGAPLQALGFATPSTDQVYESRTGVAATLSAEHRRHWAQFLLGALVCFGIVPRLLLWSWSALMLAHARRGFALDLYLPYYISLRQRLMPLASNGQIVDADTSPPEISNTPVINTSSKTPASHPLPTETQWVAVELGDNVSWPPQSISAANDLGQVSDRESLASILQGLKQNANPVIAVAVAAARAPDRGIQRTIASLVSSSTQRWLVLLMQHEDEVISNTRLASWYRLAEACKVPADHVISLSVV
ncbi:MAG: DUF2868 domain-containing protein [Gammaproteobacteria bacterium]